MRTHQPIKEAGMKGNREISTKTALNGSGRAIFKGTLILVAAVLLFTRPAAAQQMYQLYCRGPLNYVTGTVKTHVESQTLIYFTKSSNVAGYQGSLLQEGTCSRSDRTLNANEPSKVRFYEQKW